MGETKDYLVHPEDLGNIHISEDVLASIAAGAAAEVEGIGGLMTLNTKKTAGKGVRLTMDEDKAIIDLYVLVRYGYAIPEVASRIQDAVTGEVEAMTGFPVSAVNVHVGGVSFQ